ncbi:Pvc16 family protein [Kribbella sp. NPDC026611]|uniref:Pvc16 family protein n=1 Tax=Kribbella sp. NPDC026611 TaxID=3154911 RepID=UPI0033F24E47
MLDEAERAVGTLLREQLPSGTAIRTEPPSDTWYGEHQEGESIGLFLHLVRESQSAGAVQGWSEDRDESGRVVRRTAAERHYELCYLVTAWATDYERELSLLGCVLRAVAHHPFLPVSMLTGTLVEATGPIALAIGRGDAPSAAPELWSALGLRPRTFLDLVVTAPVAPVAVTELSGPPVTLDLGVDSTTGAGTSARRRAVITEGPVDGAARGQAG